MRFCAVLPPEELSPLAIEYQGSQDRTKNASGQRKNRTDGRTREINENASGMHDPRIQDFGRNARHNSDFHRKVHTLPSVQTNVQTLPCNQKKPKKAKRRKTKEVNLQSLQSKDGLNERERSDKRREAKKSHNSAVKERIGMNDNAMDIRTHNHNRKKEGQRNKNNHQSNGYNENCGTRPKERRLKDEIDLNSLNEEESKLNQSINRHREFPRNDEIRSADSTLQHPSLEKLHNVRDGQERHESLERKGKGKRSGSKRKARGDHMEKGQDRHHHNQSRCNREQRPYISSQNKQIPFEHSSQMSQMMPHNNSLPRQLTHQHNDFSLPRPIPHQHHEVQRKVQTLPRLVFTDDAQHFRDNPPTPPISLPPIRSPRQSPRQSPQLKHCQSQVDNTSISITYDENYCKENPPPLPVNPSPLVKSPMQSPVRRQAPVLTGLSPNPSLGLSLLQHCQDNIPLPPTNPPPLRTPNQSPLLMRRQLQEENVGVLPPPIRETASPQQSTLDIPWELTTDISPDSIYEQIFQ
ncbi:unnamed protein product [Meganyctiphanes norvegica]|uniref:Uncharacterized protein n=1 Tax=Meganyctiphanes norvegica TaxID=48144 RepID=A0AAV2QDR4_MEGNR